MAYPKDSGHFALDTLRSMRLCHCCFTVRQVQDEHTRVLVYGSRTLNKAECNYCITDKELLVVRYFIEYYRHLDRNVTVRTHHQALI